MDSLLSELDCLLGITTDFDRGSSVIYDESVLRTIVLQLEIVDGFIRSISEVDPETGKMLGWNVFVQMTRQVLRNTDVLHAEDICEVCRGELCDFREAVIEMLHNV